MPTMQIYKNDTKIESKEFLSDFVIARHLLEKQRLFWEADGEEVENGGGILLWIVTHGRFDPKSVGLTYEIKSVLPTWQLVIDNVAQEPRLYFDLDVTGKEIELLYGDYRFVCSFPSQENSHGSPRAD